MYEYSYLYSLAVVPSKGGALELAEPNRGKLVDTMKFYFCKSLRIYWVVTRCMSTYQKS